MIDILVYRDTALLFSFEMYFVRLRDERRYPTKALYSQFLNQMF